MSASAWNWQPAGARRQEQQASLIRLDGPDSRRFLHGQTSAAIEGSAPGSWIPSCCINATGRLLALAEVLVDADGAWLLLSSEADAVWQSLDRVLFPADRVTLGPVTPVRWITPLGDGLDGLPRAPEGQWQQHSSGGWQLGPQLVLPAQATLPRWIADRAELSALEQERWRIQQGLLAAGAEITGDTNPFELGLADRVSLSKGCYVGQETLARLATYDGVKQQLRRWHWQARSGDAEVPASAALAAGTALTDPGPEQDGSRAGLISSSLALDDGLWIGLALVRRQALAQPTLRAGGGTDAPLLTLSRAPGFVDPPIGAGRQP